MAELVTNTELVVGVSTDNRIYILAKGSNGHTKVCIDMSFETANKMVSDILLLILHHDPSIRKLTDSVQEDDKK